MTTAESAPDASTDGTVVVVAVLPVKPGRLGEALEIVRGNVPTVHAEDGCLTYAVHSASEPDRIVFVERWSSEQALAAHGASEHMRATGAAMADLVAGPVRADHGHLGAHGHRAAGGLLTDADQPPPAWAAQRTRDAAARAARLARAEAAEHERAAAMLAEFVATAGREGPAPQPLSARDASGRGELRTGLQGWYLRRDRSAAVALDGAFYLLRAHGGLGERLLSRWRPVRLRPSPAPLVLGRGGRDGDSIDLADALARVLSGQGP